MVKDIRNSALERLREGGLALGAGLRIARGVEIAKILHACDYDWLFIDLEHSAMSLETASQISNAALDVGIAAIVRVPEFQWDIATRALDGGALGIVMPHVDTPEQAREAVKRLKFPPAGKRSTVGGLPHYNYRSVLATKAAAEINAATLLAVMIETDLAVQNAEAIAAVPGIDVLFIGVNDLSVSLGVPSELQHAKIAAAFETVATACRKHKKWAGFGGAGGEALARYVKTGMQFVLGGNDFAFMIQSASSTAAALRDVYPTPR